MSGKTLKLVCTYGKAVPASGPLVSSCCLDDVRLVVRFAHAEEGLATDDGTAVRHLQILDEHGAWHELPASIDGATSVADVSDISGPHAVRYAWQPYPDPPVNLVNSAVLPASPFEMPIDVEQGTPVRNEH